MHDGRQTQAMQEQRQAAAMHEAQQAQAMQDAIQDGRPKGREGRPPPGPSRHSSRSGPGGSGGRVSSRNLCPLLALSNYEAASAKSQPWCELRSGPSGATGPERRPAHGHIHDGL